MNVSKALGIKEFHALDHIRTPEELALYVQAHVEESQSILREALARLVGKLDEIEAHPAYRGLFAELLIRGRPYTGPDYSAEKEAARSALAGIPLNASGDSAAPSSHVSGTFPESALQTAAKRMAASATVWEGFGARDVEACLRYYAEAVCAEPAATTASAPANSETDHPILTRAQADRIVSALDPGDGGHDELAAFIYRLARS